MTRKLIELAVKGCELNVLATNIAALNPSMHVAERIITGIPSIADIDTDKLQNYLQRFRKDAVVVTMENGCGFVDECLQVVYEYSTTWWFPQDMQIEADEDGFLINEELKPNGSSYEHDKFTVPVKVHVRTSTNVIPEDFLK